MVTASGTAVDLEIGCTENGLPGREDFRRWVRAALAGAGVSGRNCVSLKIVDIEEMQALNRRYRDKDKPTNVLSFAAGPVEGLPPDEARFLGDIAICAPVVRDEAEQQGKTADEHWSHMVVHGTLHLLGFDHVTETGAREMEKLEATILAAQGFADPYCRSL